MLTKKMPNFLSGRFFLELCGLIPYRALTWKKIVVAKNLNLKK